MELELELVRALALVLARVQVRVRAQEQSLDDPLLDCLVCVLCVSVRFCLVFCLFCVLILSVSLGGGRSVMERKCGVYVCVCDRACAWAQKRK